MRVAYRRGSVLLRRGDAIPREGAILGVFFSIDNALHIIAYKTHTKTAEPIEMPVGSMIRVGTRYHVLHGEPDPPGEGAFRGEKVAPHCKVMAHSTVRYVKRLNQSTCRFGRRLGWAHGTMY